MTDIWFDLLLTTLVTLATVIADRLANLLISSTSGLVKIEKVIDQPSNSKIKIEAIQKELVKYRLSKTTNIVWGSELAAIALSLDLSILGVWISNPQYFPFFTRWNTTTSSRELPVWLILIFLHFVVLLLSITLKHQHIDTIESANQNEISSSKGKKWFFQYRFMLSSNMVGFISLLSSFVIITNAV